MFPVGSDNTYIPSMADDLSPLTIEQFRETGVRISEYRPEDGAALFMATRGLMVEYAMCEVEGGRPTRFVNRRRNKWVTPAAD